MSEVGTGGELAARRGGGPVKRFAIALGALISLALLFVVSIGVASEVGGELVVLETRDADGETVETSLWVVDDGGAAWLRAGVPTSGWLTRIESDPEVVVTRAGERIPFRAVPVREPEARERTHALMRAKYGLADRWISLIRDGRRSVAVRLDPAPARR